MKQKYRVILPIEVDGRVYQFNEEIELDLGTAALYAHALIPLEVEHGGDS